MTDVSVLGTGLMGSAIARSLLRAGRTVTVWNRTAARAEALRADGAVLAATADEALEASPLAIIVVIDAVAEGGLLERMGTLAERPDVVSLRTGSTADAKALAEFADSNRFAVLEGTVIAFPEEVGHAGSRVMFSGSRDVWERHRETLLVLGGGSEFIGTGPEAVRALNNANECLFIPGLVSMMEAAAYGKAAGVSDALMMRSLSEAVSKLAEYWEYAAAKLASGDHSTEMASIDAWLGGAARAAEDMRALGFAGRVIDAAVATLVAARDNGEGSSDVTAVYRSELSAAQARRR